MKWFLIFWAGPIVFLAGWYWLSYYDMNFGIFMLTRQVHDLTFQIYGNVLGIPPETIPPLVARAIVVDSLIVFAILGYRKRKAIIAWWQARQASKPSAAVLDSKDSLSRAP
ncbi:hypothetical protein A6U87_16950 [Rhizobium sp. AC44/96]|jgi:hypothetical protein|uniref:DUF6105 family protein n=1 Tax=unclassified Rhizobium TaxID=2613769 RepID=UPI00080F8072|nr:MULTISPECIES: DUF6105 family protein [unclassified Rhizobium]MDM9619674.1 DUF6105 family protein [Rhizobium sp. S96]OCJ03634.1 hypothetical protein A6U87_16950 [Rhizobium sp. AC44/96]